MTDRTKAAYQSRLRTLQKNETGQAILNAFGTVIRQSNLASFSMSEVARVAGVTDQTVYRHFRSRNGLIKAFTKSRLEQEVGGPDVKLPDTIDEMLAWAQIRYQAWEENSKIVSESYLSPIGCELRQPLFELGYNNIQKMVIREAPGLRDDLRDSIASALVWLLSTENFMFLHHTLKYDAATVHGHVVNAINVARRGMHISVDQ